MEISLPNLYEFPKKFIVDRIYLFAFPHFDYFDRSGKFTRDGSLISRYYLPIFLVDAAATFFLRAQSVSLHFRHFHSIIIIYIF